MSLKALKSLPSWLRFAILGAATYPSLIIILLILSEITQFLPVPFLHEIFTTAEGVLLLPSYQISLSFAAKIPAAVNSSSPSAAFESFRTAVIAFQLIFSGILGFLIGSGILGIGRIAKRLK